MTPGHRCYEHKVCHGGRLESRRQIADTCAELMARTGSFLDISRGMTPVTCAVAEFSRVNHAAATPAPRGEFSPEAKFFPRHVLVVDDEPLIRWSVTEALADIGMDVEQASDAHNALRIVTSAPRSFNVVVLDLRLPDMDDLSLLGTLRQLLPDARLVLMTAFGTPEVVAEAEAIGATVITKPFELDDLKQLITN